MPKIKRLVDTYRYPGFKPSLTVKHVSGDADARVIEFTRIKKKPSVQSVTTGPQRFTTGKCDASVIFHAATELPPVIRTTC